MNDIVVITVDENSAQAAVDAAAASQLALDKLLATSFGVAIPADVPAGTGFGYWLSVTPGPYPNHGGVVVNSGSLALILRSEAGAFSVSQSALTIPAAENKISFWAAEAYPIGTQRNHLGKDWYLPTSAALSTDVPGTSSKWVERLSAYKNKADLVPKKNLFNKETTVDGFYRSASNSIVAMAGFCYSDFIAVVAGSNYKATTSLRFTTYFDSNKNYVAGGNSTATTAAITIPAGVSFIVFTLEGLALKDTCQFELGTVSTTYDAYKLIVKDSQLNLSDYAKTIDLPSIINPLIAKKADLVLGENLFNYADPNVLRGFFLKASGVATAFYPPFDLFSVSGFIPATAGQVFKINQANQVNTYHCFYDSTGAFIPASNSILNTVTAPVYTAFVRFTLQINSIANIETANIQIELGSRSTSYKAYGLVVKDSQIPKSVQLIYNNKIACPLKQHFLTTIENNIYLAEFQKRVLPNFILDTTPAVGLRKNDIIRALNPAVGSYAVTNALVDLDYNEVMRKNYTAVVTDLSKTTAINVLSVGDSYTDIGQYVKKMGQTIPNVNHVGLCKAATGSDVRREGRSGWTLAQYMTQTGSTAGNGFFSPFLHPVSPYTYYGNTGFWQKVYIGTAPGYEITSFVPWITTLNINSSGVRSTPAVNDVMYFTVDSAYKVWNGSAWTVISAATLGFTFNFSKYLTTWSIPTPNVMTILLGMNDFRNIALTAFDAFFVGWKGNLDTFIANAKEANASVKIVIATCNSTEYNDLSGMANAALWEGYNAIIAAYDNREGENIFISDTKVSVDRVFGYSYTNGKPYALYSGTDTIKLTGGDVHLGTDGMNQIGEKLAATIQCIRP